MANLISSSARLIYEQARDDVFDTFSRPCIVYVTPEKTIISQDLNYSFSYSNPESQDDTDLVTYEPIRYVFDVCVLYKKELTQLSANKQGSREENLGLQFDNGDVRIKIKKEDYNLIKNSINFEIDGDNFYVDKTPRPHGLFEPKYYTLYLKFKN